MDFGAELQAAHSAAARVRDRMSFMGGAFVGGPSQRRIAGIARARVSR